MPLRGKGLLVALSSIQRRFTHMPLRRPKTLASAEVLAQTEGSECQ